MSFDHLAAPAPLLPRAGPVAQNPFAPNPTASSPNDIPSIDASARASYDNMFHQLVGTPNGNIEGAQAKLFFAKSGLPNQQLAQIWQLADLDQSGSLDREEFAIAFHLCQAIRIGFSLPAQVPRNLVPQSKLIYYQNSATKESEWVSVGPQNGFTSISASTTTNSSHVANNSLFAPPSLQQSPPAHSLQPTPIRALPQQTSSQNQYSPQQPQQTPQQTYGATSSYSTSSAPSYATTSTPYSTSSSSSSYAMPSASSSYSVPSNPSSYSVPPASSSYSNPSSYSTSSAYASAPLTSQQLQLNNPTYSATSQSNQYSSNINSQVDPFLSAPPQHSSSLDFFTPTPANNIYDARQRSQTTANLMPSQQLQQQQQLLQQQQHQQRQRAVTSSDFFSSPSHPESASQPHNMQQPADFFSTPPSTSKGDFFSSPSASSSASRQPPTTGNPFGTNDFFTPASLPPPPPDFFAQPTQSHQPQGMHSQDFFNTAQPQQSFGSGAKQQQPYSADPFAAPAQQARVAGRPANSYGASDPFSAPASDPFGGSSDPFGSSASTGSTGLVFVPPEHQVKTREVDASNTYAFGPGVSFEQRIALQGDLAGAMRKVREKNSGV